MIGTHKHRENDILSQGQMFIAPIVINKTGLARVTSQSCLQTIEVAGPGRLAILLPCVASVLVCDLALPIL